MKPLILFATLSAASLPAANSTASPQQVDTQVTSALLLSGKAEVGGSVELRGAKFMGTLSTDGTFKVSGGGELGPGEFALSASFGAGEVCVGADYSTDAETALRSGAVSAVATEGGGGVNFKGGVGVSLCVDFDKPIPLRPVEASNRNLQRIILVPSGKLLVLPGVEQKDAGSSGGGGGGGAKPRAKVDADGGIEFTDSIESFCSDQELGIPRFAYKLDDSPRAWALSERLAKELNDNPELLRELEATREPYHKAVSSLRLANAELEESGYNPFWGDDTEFEPLIKAAEAAYEGYALAGPPYGEARKVIQDFVWRTEKLVFLNSDPTPELNSDPTPEARLWTVHVKSTPKALWLLDELAIDESWGVAISPAPIWQTVVTVLGQLKHTWKGSDSATVRVHTFPESIQFSQVVFSDKEAATEAENLLATETKLGARSLAVPVPDELVEPETVNNLAARHRREPYLSESTADAEAAISATWLVPSCIDRYGLEGAINIGEGALELFGEEGAAALRAALKGPRAVAMELAFIEADDGTVTWSFIVTDNAGKSTFFRSGEL